MSFWRRVCGKRNVNTFYCAVDITFSDSFGGSRVRERTNNPRTASEALDIISEPLASVLDPQSNCKQKTFHEQAVHAEMQG